MISDSSSLQKTAHNMAKTCLAKQLRCLNRVITRSYDDALRPYGLTINQLNILVVVVCKPSIQPSQLGQILEMEKSTVSRTVERMVRQGWLEVMNTDADRRSQLLNITGLGCQLLMQAAPAWQQAQGKAIEWLTPAGMAAICEANAKL